ncbi:MULTISPECIES: hypothetical protein [unclassified Pelosinus]|jgi:hypothetical protein|uniref:hypothetical protein n=1 Tax=unclassified Pelosinus TaxID=2629460 RepID=UPI0004D0CB38|nr:MULTISPECIES: hypothetical protein [unclassified Pelosinus]AIF50540.1 hypothetical protein UFO1_0985 [Pelosinus sp. UFO1]GMA97484.1 hypothetical protein PIPA1_02840 [Pelosinus sp. IPA-1]
MTRSFTLYSDQLKKLLLQVEQNVQKNPLATDGITIMISDGDPCLKVFQKVGHDWIYLDQEEFREW